MISGENENTHAFCPPFMMILDNGQQNPVAERRGFVVVRKGR